MKTFIKIFCIFGIVPFCDIAPVCKPVQQNVVIHQPVSKGLSENTQKTIHVFVALCDNKYQGIVPVPANIGNGQDPGNNLYWGCAFGIRTYFKNSSKWKLLKKFSIDSVRMERVIFKHSTAGYLLIADAYNGKYIKQCTIDFLESCAGIQKETIEIDGRPVGIKGNAGLISYIGHDGLMDFQLHEQFVNKDNVIRKAIILACISKKYFSHYLATTKAIPLVWSTGFMSPEAYTLHDAIESYIKNETSEQICASAAKAYSKYQKCSYKAASKLLVHGY